ncbi:hypothetical protein C8Q76DRAFT_697672 [Earliella scabrosa]|nr:hypothetical protein C8Q76DRAFT_697672 [Earliella scabrosa]
MSRNKSNAASRPVVRRDALPARIEFHGVQGRTLTAEELLKVKLGDRATIVEDPHYDPFVGTGVDSIDIEYIYKEHLEVHNVPVDKGTPYRAGRANIAVTVAYNFGAFLKRTQQKEDTNAKQKQAEIKNEIRSSSSQLALALRPMPIAVQVPELKGISILRLERMQGKTYRVIYNPSS